MNDNVYNIGDRRPRMTERPLADLVRETRDEFLQFVNTRIAMLLSEMKEKIGAIKSAAPLLVIGALVVATTWLLLTGAIVAAVMVAFAGSAYAPLLAFVIVAVVYGLVGGSVLWVGYRKLTAASLVPERTIQVLREDKTWLENEARTL